MFHSFLNLSIVCSFFCMEILIKVYYLIWTKIFLISCNREILNFNNVFFAIKISGTVPNKIGLTILPSFESYEWRITASYENFSVIANVKKIKVN